MKKVMRFLVVCSMAMLAMACSEDNTDGPDVTAPDASPVELKSIVFEAADNGDCLAKDMAVESIIEEKAGSMIVRVAGGGAGKKLTMTLTAGANNIVKVNGKEVACAAGQDGTVSGKAAFDATFPADITVSNEAGESKKYVVKVGKILETVVEKVATYTEPGCNITGAIMAVNPKDNTPYIFYLRRAEGTTIDQGTVIKWNGTSFDLVGPSGFTGENKASGTYMAFDKDGVPYVLYVDTKAASGIPVKRLGAGNWETVGTEGFSMKVGTSLSTPSMFINPANNYPVAMYQVGGTKTTPNYREMARAEWNGNSWTEALTGLAPAVEGSKNVFTLAQSVQVGDAVYVAVAYNETGYYVCKLQNGAWTTIVDPLATPFYTGAKPHSGYIDIFADNEKNIYVVAGDDTAAAGSWDMQIYKLDEAGKTLKPYGNVATVGWGISREQMAAAVNPVTGEIVGAYVGINGEEKDLMMYSTINEDLQWNPFTKLSEVVAHTTQPCIKFGSDGIGYILFVGNADKNNRTIELFRIGKEADILPE